MTTQQRTALDKANMHRRVQADLKRSLREHNKETGKLVALGVISDPALELAAMRVERLLLGIHRMGAQKVGRILRAAQISSTRRIGDLTDSERTRLERALLT